MRVLQLLPSLKKGDGVGNFAFNLKEILQEMDFRTEIYSEKIDANVPKNMAKKLSDLRIKDDDVILYHMCTGTSLNYKVMEYKCKKIMIYHNITPPHFYKQYSLNSYNACTKGYEDVEAMKNGFDAVVPMSAFNKKCLLEYGYSEENMYLLPFLLEKEEKKRNILDKTKNTNQVNLLYVGRMVPHKRVEDIVSAFVYYKKYYNENAVLNLIGSNGPEEYMQPLKAYIKSLKIEGLNLLGHVSDCELERYYQTADLYVSMSEYEGFCLPIIEAMLYEIPVLAYNAAAVADTLGKGGILWDKKSPIYLASIMNYMIENKSIREEIINNQKEELEKYSKEKVMAALEHILVSVIGN